MTVEYIHEGTGCEYRKDHRTGMRVCTVYSHWRKQTMPSCMDRFLENGKAVVYDDVAAMDAELSERLCYPD